MGKSRVKGIVVEIGGDTMGLDKALDGTNKKIGTTQSKLKDVERLLKLDPKNTVLLEQKQKLLAQAVEETENKLQSLNNANDQVKETVKNYDAWKAAYDPIQAEIDTTTQKLKELKNKQQEMADCGEVDTDAYQHLTQEIQNTSKELRDLKDQAKKVNEEFGNPVSADQYDALQREIVETKNDLKTLVDKAEDTARKINNIDEKPIEDVEQAADGAAGALGKASKEASTFGDVLKAEAIVEGAKGILNWAKGTAESTQEYRNNMAQLEVSSEAAGYSAEQTREAYYSLYGVLGDEQSAMTAVANLQALQLPQEQLMALIDNVIGAWAKYGDSIPIESLAESINETVKTGKVTGTLADVLNWGSAEGERFGVVTKQNAEAQRELNTAAQEFTRSSQGYIDALWEGIDAQSNDISSAREAVDVRAAESTAMESLAEKTEKVTVKKKEASDANEEYNKTVEAATTAEEFFNIALSDRNSETERASFLLETLVNQGLSNMAQKLRENNASMIEANQASADWQEQLAILGEEIEPLLTDLLEMVTKFLKGFNELDPGTQKLIISLVGLVAVIGPLGNAFDGASKIIGLFSKDGLSGLISKLGILSGDTLPEVTTTFDKATNKWVMKLDTSMEAITGGILPSLQTAFTTVFGFIKAHPIAALVTAIAFFGDDIQNILQGVDDFLQQIFATDWEQVFGPVLGGALNNFSDKVKNIWDAIKQILDGVIDFIRGVFTGDWERAWKGVLSCVQVPVNGIITLVNGIISACNLAIDALNKLPGVDIEHRRTIDYWGSNERAVTGLEWTQEEINRIIENDPEYMVSLLPSDGAEKQSTVNSNTHTSSVNFGDINIYASGDRDNQELTYMVMDEIQRHYDSAEAALT